MIVTVVVPAAAAAAVGPYTLAPYTLAPYTLALPAGPGGVGALNLTNPELDLVLNSWPGAGEGLGS